jgi:mannose-6-phosphate isomerase-like protein (cupin superfamily)
MNWHTSYGAIMAEVEKAHGGRRFHYPVCHGTMRVGLYAPKDADEQSPHTQDELYIIASGSGWFVKGDDRIAFAPQDVLFVEAGLPHRFENFTADFATWVIFWGPEGGEVAGDGKI